MGSQLYQVLRKLCFNTGWNYTIFWKLKHQAPMVLSWEDAYCDYHEPSNPSESKWFGGNPGSSNDGHMSQHSLGLIVANMSYHLYALGEGTVGHVAVTGKHLWVSANKHAMKSRSFSEYPNELIAQFSAGVKTIAFVAVVPYGVVQIGSLNDIAEDLKLVNHIRDSFFELQDFFEGHISSIDGSSCLSNVSARSSASQNYHDLMQNAYKNLKNQKPNILLSTVFQSPEKHAHSYSAALPEVYSQEMVMINNDLGTFESTDVLKSSLMNSQKQVYGKLTINRKSEGEIRSMRGDVNVSSFSSAFHGIAPSINQNGMFPVPEIYHGSHASSEKTLEFRTEINNMDACRTCFKFSSGCELYEALGPSFKKQNANYEVEAHKTVSGTAVSMSDEGTSSNLLTVNPGMEHLLEAVVANVCQSVSEVKCENPTSGSVKPHLTAEKVLEPSASVTQTIGSAGYSYDQSSLVEETLNCLASGTCGFRSSKGLSSTSSTKCSDQLEGPLEQAKIGKKRARPGESSRPRPRDRQLIQDRIKELRELVPNGSKCSIDSLLERTIKHMLFMQCITKHADKLDKCVESKGSSWAVEVENNSGVCPIMVENKNMNGQMVVKILCEDCSQFFEIAEAIRILDLAILKGATEAYGNEIWMCFVVEGQNNRNMERMDILWSLLQILQPKTEI